MAGVLVPLQAGVVILDSGDSALNIKVEPGDFTFTRPQINKDPVMDRGKWNGSFVCVSEELIEWSFTCKFLDDQTVDTIRTHLAATENLQFKIDSSVDCFDADDDITYTFYYVRGTVEVAEAEKGMDLSVSGNAIGYSDGTDSYGYVS